MSHRVRGFIVTVLLIVPVAFVLLSSHVQRDQRLKKPSEVAHQDVGTTASVEQLAHAQPTSANKINLSQAYINDGRYGQAVELLAALLTTEPNNVVAWNNLCVAHTFLKEYDSALESCNRGIKANASFQLVRNNLKWAQEERGKVVLALAAQQKTEQSRRDAAFYLSEGLNYLHLGAYEEAESAWHRANEVDPASALPWNNLGTAEMMQHHYSTALQDFQKAKALDTNSELIQNNIAWAQASINKTR